MFTPPPARPAAYGVHGSPPVSVHHVRRTLSPHLSRDVDALSQTWDSAGGRAMSPQVKQIITGPSGKSSPPAVLVKRLQSQPTPRVVHRERSSSPVRVSAPYSSFEAELKELRSILEMQQHQQLPQAARSAEDEQRAQLQVQLFQRVACQQAEQESLLQALRASVTVLQQQVQFLMHPPKDDKPQVNTPEKLKEELHVAVDTNELWDKVKKSMSEHENEMKGWFAEFCVTAMKETVGPSIQLHAEAIKSLDGRMADLSEVAKQAEAIKSLNMQVDELNEVTKRGLSSLQHILCQAGLSPPPDEGLSPQKAEGLSPPPPPSAEPTQSSNVVRHLESKRQQAAAELPRQLHTIAEDASETHDTDSAESISLAKVNYDSLKRRLGSRVEPARSAHSSSDTYSGDVAGG
mmetsp:Transcript_136108/g.261475  ORF Transcript_136108/g.261475 Transcript_136108/m.261475 type:complete len:405 (-) Transcript_136108:86-1300(-)